MKTKQFFVLILAICFLPLFGAPAAQAEEGKLVVITLPEIVRVQGTRMLLGEIGEVSGEYDLATRVKEVNAGTAPLAGASRRLTRGQIEVRLRQAGIDLSRLEFAGAATVQVYGAQLSNLDADNLSQDSPASYEVVVVTRDVERGQVLLAEDLALEKREMRGSVRDAGQLWDFVGLRAKRYLGKGTVVTEQSVEVIPVIERGAQIRIIAKLASIYVTVPGVARATGNKGDLIPVENSVSRQIVYAEIVDAQTVQVIVRGSELP